MHRLPYYNPELSRAEIKLSPGSVNQVIELLNDPRLADEINAGNVTLAMIRPHVGPDANNLGLSDIDAAHEIESLIENLGYITKFSFQFNTDAVEEFYGGDPKESMSKGTARDESVYSNRWFEFRDSMTAGPTTAILLYSTDGDAIPLWRAHLGHWNIDNERDPKTIRGKLGVNKYNNLVHGSDAPESVIRELEIIKSCLLSTLGD